jgi:hypothetical protein
MYHRQLPLSLRRSAPPGTLVASKLKLQSEKVKEFFDKPIKTIVPPVETNDILMKFYGEYGMQT